MRHNPVFFQIVVPLSAPIIAVMALFNAVSHWNEYFQALVYLSNQNIYPLQLFLRDILVTAQEALTRLLNSGNVSAMSIREQTELANSIKYAVMIVSSIPLLAFYPFLQRFFIKGIMIGSIKG